MGQLNFMTAFNYEHADAILMVLANVIPSPRVSVHSVSASEPESLPEHPGADGDRDKDDAEYPRCKKCGSLNLVYMSSGWRGDEFVSSTARCFDCGHIQTDGIEDD